MTLSSKARLALSGLCALAVVGCGDGSERSADEPVAVTDEAASAPAAEVAYASLTGDAANGRRVFARCTVCHAVQEGVNRVGPSLHAIIDRPTGAVEGFSYSDANRDADLTWTEEEMFDYLRDPQARIPGTIMAFAGLPDAQDRADVIAYLKTED